MRRPEDWFRQAQRDLDAARHNRSGGHFEWACFLSQQAAEKAAKALFEAQGVEAWGHSVGALLEELAPRPEVREVVLFGSLARGDWSVRSDADVVVVIDESGEPFHRRSGSYMPRGTVGIGVDLFVYTADETSAWGPRFRAEIDGGIVLHRREE